MQSLLKSSQFDLEKRIFYRFSILVGRHLRYFAATQLPKHKLSVQAWLILTVIGRFCPLSPSELAEKTSVRRDKITRVVDRLVEKDLVLRENDNEDRRRVILTLSAKGRHVCESLELVAREVDAYVVDALNSDERTIFEGILNKIERAATMRLALDARAPS
jgi:DNA-binding MarR family transcriptional regulator